MHELLHGSRILLRHRNHFYQFAISLHFESVNQALKFTFNSIQSFRRLLDYWRDTQSRNIFKVDTAIRWILQEYARDAPKSDFIESGDQIQSNDS